MNSYSALLHSYCGNTLNMNAVTAVLSKGLKYYGNGQTLKLHLICI